MDCRWWRRIRIYAELDRQGRIPHYELDSATYTFPGISVISGKLDVETIKAGINYKF